MSSVWKKVFEGRNELSEIYLEEQNIGKKPYQRRGVTEYYRCRNMKKYSCSFKLRTVQSEDKDLSLEGSHLVVVETFDKHKHDESTARTQGPPGLHKEVRKVLKSASELELLPKIRKRKVDEVSKFFVFFFIILLF
jgi:hypothetical protein